MEWLIASIVIGGLLDLAGGISAGKKAREEAKARQKLADIQIEQQELAEGRQIEQLEKQRDITVSRQQARTGRGGLTAEGSPLIVEQSILETFGTAGKVRDVREVRDVSNDGLFGGPLLSIGQEVVGGSGAIGYVQQQGILARQAISKQAEIATAGAPSDFDIAIGALATTLDAATNIWAFDYQFNQTQIPGNVKDPFSLRESRVGWELF